MRVLVTGGTGFLGYRLIEKLNKNQSIDEVIASGRKIKPSHFVESAKVKYVIGELSDKTFVQELTKNIDVVDYFVMLTKGEFITDEFPSKH